MTGARGLAGHNAEPQPVPASAPMTVSRESSVPPLARMLRQVADRTGKSYQTQVGELITLCLRNNKLTIEEYFDLGVYKESTAAHKLAYLGKNKSREIWAAANGQSSWRGAVEDKLAAGALFKGAGYPVPEVVACYSPTLSVPGIQALSTAHEVVQFLRSQAGTRLFGKPVGSLQSLGSIAIDSICPDTGKINAASGEVLDLEAFAEVLAENYSSGYLFQERLSPHSIIAEICGDRLATIRVLTICQDHGPKIIASAWKIPTSTNMADNFWRPGNLAADIDLGTGLIRRVVQGKGLQQKEITHHPDTGRAIAGTTVPCWEEVLSLVNSVAAFVKDVRLIGWDIAVTPNGPMIVEGNITPDMTLHQQVTGRGILDGAFRDYVAWLRSADAVRQKAWRDGTRKEDRSEVKRVLRGITQG